MVFDSAPLFIDIFFFSRCYWIRRMTQCQWLLTSQREREWRGGGEKNFNAYALIWLRKKLFVAGEIRFFRFNDMTQSQECVWEIEITFCFIFVIEIYIYIIFDVFDIRWYRTGYGVLDHFRQEMFVRCWHLIIYWEHAKLAKCFGFLVFLVVR